jgi:hypothetical protein
MRTRIALGFDGSMSDDFTVIKAETEEGLLFTPVYGSQGLPTIWNPAEWDGSIPRGEVDAALDQLFDEYDVGRLYADPPLWQSELEAWALKYGSDKIVPFPTYHVVRMHKAIQRFVADLQTGKLKHDGCPITSQHVGNARRSSKASGSTGRYLLAKADRTAKIDAAVASVVAHEATSDCRSDLWSKKTRTRVMFI